MWLRQGLLRSFVPLLGGGIRRWKALALTAATVGLILAPLSDATASGKPDDGRDAANDQVEHQVLFPRANYLWPFAAGPSYGEIESSRWGDRGVLHTAVGSFDTARGLPNTSGELRTTNKLNRLGAQYFLLQVDPASFGDGGFDRIRETISARGGAIVQELTVAGFVARLNQTAFTGLEGQPGVIFLEPYHPAFKLNPMLGRAPLPDPRKALSDIWTLEVSLFRGENSAIIAQAIARLGGNVLYVGGDLIRVELNRRKLAELAAIEGIQEIFESLPVALHGQEFSVDVQTGLRGSNATSNLAYNNAGVDGGGNGIASNQILMVLDSGIQLDAGDLSETRTAPAVPGSTSRKVLVYADAALFGGDGDLLGCDSLPSGGFTHGHGVSAVALGNATNVLPGYGGGWIKNDPDGNPWRFDGIAPKAKLIAYDAQDTPAFLGCDSPNAGGLIVGNLYDRVNRLTCTGNPRPCGSLQDSYNQGARTSNFSWGVNNVFGVYGTNASNIDKFISDNPFGMVFVAAGNSGGDTDQNGIPDEFGIADPATCKSCVVVGMSDVSNAVNRRHPSSSAGPATVASNRIAPVLMAPGTDSGGVGFAETAVCRSISNGQGDPVDCSTTAAHIGTSFASPLAAGAALLVRDYFAQGFLPDGTSANAGNSTELFSSISGALVKAILVESADWIGNPSALDPTANGTNLSKKFRPNREQGYGRIKLTNALPLTTFPSNQGLLVVDVSPGPNNSGGSLDAALPAGTSTDSGTFEVCGTTKGLQVALVWTEDSGDTLTRNLDLEVVSPTGRLYLGNVTTDDENRNQLQEAGEDCGVCSNDRFRGCTVAADCASTPGVTCATGTIQQSPWSFNVDKCANATVGARDIQNPVEGVFLSPDPAVNGIADDPATSAVDESIDNQIEAGTWTVKVIGQGLSGAQDYALAISGPLCVGGSSVRTQPADATVANTTGQYACNDRIKVVVNEKDETGDPSTTGAHGVGVNNNGAEIKTRTTLQVIDPVDGVFDNGNDVVVDSESSAAGIAYTDSDGPGPGLEYASSAVALTDGTAPDPGNGVLDIRNGHRIKVFYADEIDNAPVASKLRTGVATVNCATRLSFGAITYGQLGRDTLALISGGCDRDARGSFTFGFPDKYMDAGETIVYHLAFQSTEAFDLEDVQATMRAVLVDTDSPADCVPGTTACADPNRANNPMSTDLTILDSPKNIGFIPAGAAIGAKFTVLVNNTIVGAPTIEMVLGISSKKSSRPVESFAVSRHRLDVDEVSRFYSTDFPSGGTENRDVNRGPQSNTAKGIDTNTGNESIETPVTTNPRDFLTDYVVEARSFSSMLGTNPTITPWNFDSSDNGFRSGINNTSTKYLPLPPAHWGEDKNFDGVWQAGEDRAGGTTSMLDQNWSTRGGCGWVTRLGTGGGGVWHTGHIDMTTVADCLGQFGVDTTQCSKFDVLPGSTGKNAWWELLTTPALHKVNNCPAPGSAAPCADPNNGSPIARTDQTGAPVFTVEFTNWAWNQAIDVGDEHTRVTWELDNDLDSTEFVDLLNDSAVTGALSGPLGALSGGNSPLTDGFQLFAGIDDCIDTNGDGTVDHCTRNAAQTCSTNNRFCEFDATVACTTDFECLVQAGGGICEPPPGCSQASYNGTAGGNRQARNNCFFEGPLRQRPYGLPMPYDDDVRQGWCTNPADSTDKSRTCTAATQAVDCAFTGYAVPCVFDGATTIDQFVTANGPIRNHDLRKANGPDMRFDILEDRQGGSGTNFQGAVGFETKEGTSISPASSSFGVAVDDMVMEWREFSLNKQTASKCSGGACAVVQLQTDNLYDPNSFVTITVIDSTPYDATNPKNDCNGNGLFTDAGDDTDCDNNGTQDVTVKLFSDAEPAGELLVLNKTTGAGWRGNIPISTAFNSPGVLYVVRPGAGQPTIRAQYDDRNGGTGQRCKNDPDPAKLGFVEDTTTLFIPTTTGALGIVELRIVDPGPPNGDADGIPDTSEAVDLYITIKNNSGVDLDRVSLFLSTSDPKIKCITAPRSDILGLLKGQSKETPTPFKFTVSETADRAAAGKTVDDDYSAIFSVTTGTDRSDIFLAAGSLKVDLDLNVSGGGAQAPDLTEGFEEGTFGIFTSMTIDAYNAPSAPSLAASDGYRCQYNDPDGPNPNHGGPPRTTCFMGISLAKNGYDWVVHTTTASDGGRAYAGNKSLHYGLLDPDPAKFTTRLSQLDAIRMTDPFNIGYGHFCADGLVHCTQDSDCASHGGTCQPHVQSLLTWKQQISTLDNRGSGTPAGEAADRSVVQMQLADASGNPLGSWFKPTPFENSYDAQGTDQFSNCTFDPIDDGNNEDNYFNPTDPNRRHGPSSTCWPEFVWAFQGDTDWRNPFIPGRVGRAKDDKVGLQGSINRGTWVQPKIDLDLFIGRRARLRFLSTSIEIGSTQDYNAAGFGPQIVTDDGWWIDDIRITGLIASPATVALDGNLNNGPPVCAACSAGSTTLTANPPTLDTPGQPVELTAAGTGQCANGELQFQFLVNGQLNPSGRDWTGNNVFLDAPGDFGTTTYSVKTRCSTDAANTGCIATGSAAVTVNCPVSGSLPALALWPSGDPVQYNVGGAANRNTMGWATARSTDAFRGDLMALRAAVGNFTGTATACLLNNTTSNAFIDPATPAGGQAFFYITRQATGCNQSGTWRETMAEPATKDTQINASPSPCP